MTKKFMPVSAAIILGALFIMSGLMVLLNLVKMPPIPEGTPMAMFMAAFGPTGYMKFVKVFEVIGGLLVMVPLTRNLGLLILGPIIVNIIAFHLFIAGPAGLLQPMFVVIVALTLYLLYVGRNAFLGLLNWTHL